MWRVSWTDPTYKVRRSVEVPDEHNAEIVYGAWVRYDQRLGHLEHVTRAEPEMEKIREPYEESPCHEERCPCPSDCRNRSVGPTQPGGYR